MPGVRSRRRGIALYMLGLFLITLLIDGLWLVHLPPLESGGRALLVAVLGGLCLWWYDRSYRRRRDRLLQAMDALSGSDFQTRLDTDSFHEFAGLAERINRWAAAWTANQTTSRQRQEQEATILSAMVEGVMAVDHHQHITHVNKAAARLLNLDGAPACGRLLQEVVRQPEMHRLVQQASESGRPGETELTWHGAAPRVLQVRASALQAALDRPRGVVLVFHDITELRRLEQVQRDFVANVSHEFKTPLTSLKGFVETLQDGALDEPAEARRFVGIMGRQVDRLQALVEDVLSLSRMEQEAGHEPVVRQEASLREVLANALEACGPAAARKEIEVRLACEESARACINTAMVEQAAINLIDNAIKYSEARTRVEVEVARDNGHWKLAVRDQGPGIEARHLPLLFERFYRVDKSRSRKAGGTGLGLSIVRHIAEAHGGRVDVQSQLGQGSVFSLLLPA